MAIEGRGSAPGRLDFLGGVSDYSGSLVLEAAIQLETRISIKPSPPPCDHGNGGGVILVARNDDTNEVQSCKNDTGEGTSSECCSTGRFNDGIMNPNTKTTTTKTLSARSAQFPKDGEVRFSMDDLESRASEGLDRVRLLLSSSNAPKWANYDFGAFVAYCRDVAKRYPQESLRVTVDSDVPLGEGVSSSASVEVAVCRALRDYYYEGEGVDYDDDEDPLRVARVCQSAENEVCGAPCGIMDQIACLLGQHGQLLPIDCGTVATLPPAYLPEDALVVGFPTKVRHHHAGANTPYQRARTATAMGCKIAMGVVPEIRSLADVSRLVTPWVYERHVRGLLPETLGGRKFLDDHGDVAEVDALSQVDPEEDYPVGACLEFASKATFYANLALSLLEGAAFSDAESRHRVLTRVGLTLSPLPSSCVLSNPPIPFHPHPFSKGRRAYAPAERVLQQDGPRALRDRHHHRPVDVLWSKSWNLRGKSERWGIGRNHLRSVQ